MKYLKLASRIPEFREQLNFEHFSKVFHTGRSAGASFKPNDPLNRRYVIKAPPPKVILEINKFLGQLIKRPMGLGVTIDTGPYSHTIGISDMRLIHPEHVRRKSYIKLFRQALQGHMIQEHCLQFLAQHVMQFGAMLTHLHHGAIAIPQNKFN